MQDNISPGTVEQDEGTNEANQTTEVLSCADVPALDASELQDSVSHKESQSPNVSDSSDVVSATPPKPSSRRQSFITLEKYAEGRPASSSSVKKFTGPHSRISCSPEPPKSQNDSKFPQLAAYSQTETDVEVSKELATNITQESTNQGDAQHVEIKAEIKSVAKCPSEGTKDDVIPDTQTQELNVRVDTANKSSDKSSVEVNTEIASPSGESEVFAASQDSSQVEPRRSGRRRSRPVLPGEESDQESKSKQQKKAPVNASPDAQKSTPLKKTDILPTRTRRSRVHEENMSEGGKLQNSEHKDAQHESQVPSVATTVSSSQGRRSRSKEVVQTDPAIEKPSPLSQTDKRGSPLNQSDSQSHSRPVRQTRLTNANIDVSGKSQRFDKSQGDTPARVSKQLDSSASDTDSQSPGRPRRARRAERAEVQSDKPGLRSEQMSDPSHDQTPTTSKWKVGRRKKVEGELSNISKDPTESSSSVNSEVSQGNEISDSQGRGKYRTRRSSQALLASVETSETDASDTREAQRSKRARGQKSTSEVMPNTAMNENAPGNTLGTDAAVSSSVPMDVSEKEPEACLDIGAQNEVQDFHKGEASAAEGQALEHYTSEVKSVDVEQQNDTDSKMPTDSDKEELVNTGLEERAVEKETLPSSQNSLQLPAKVGLKAPELRTCPHSKRVRGRRRSTNCNCLQVRSTPSKEEGSNSQVVQDLKENKVLLESSSLPTEAVELNSITSVLPEKESAALQDSCPEVANVQPSPSLASLTETEVPAETPEEKHNESVSQSSDVNEEAIQEEQRCKDEVNDTDDKHEEMEQDKISSEDAFSQEQPQEGLSASDATPCHSQPVEDTPVCQEQSKSPVSQEKMVHSEEKTEMPEKEELVPELDGAVTALPEGTESDRTPHEEGDDGEATQIDKDLQPETALPCEASVPPQTASVEACLDSPPKEKSSDSLCRNTEVRQSPSNSVTRGVWSPSASPSTSILKKGQKRQCEEDSPSPLIKVEVYG